MQEKEELRIIPKSLYCGLSLIAIHNKGTLGWSSYCGMLSHFEALKKVLYWKWPSFSCAPPISIDLRSKSCVNEQQSRAKLEIASFWEYLHFSNKCKGRHISFIWRICQMEDDSFRPWERSGHGVQPLDANSKDQQLQPPVSKWSQGQLCRIQPASLWIG